MKTLFHLAVLAVMIAIAPGTSFALWDLAPVSTGEAKKIGLEVRAERSGPNHIRVELEFKPEGQLKNFSHVDLRIGDGDNPPLTAPLREDRSKPGRVIVSFTADRAQLEKLHLWVMVTAELGGSVYTLRVRDFVDPKKDR